MNDHLEPTDNAPQQGSASAPVSGVSEAPSPQPALQNADAPPVRVNVRNGPSTVRQPVKRPMPSRRPANGPGRPPRPAGPKRPSQGGSASRPAHPHHHHAALTDEADDSFFGKHRAKIIGAVIALVVGGGVYFVKTSKPATTTKAPEVVKISMMMPKMPIPPPPPPPPKVQQPQKDEKMVAETQVEEKHEEPPKPVDAPPTLGTNLKGEGPGMSGLGASGNGGGFGGGGGRGGSKWGWYAGEVQRSVTDALRRNSKTKTASMKIRVRIWPDKTGRITRAQLDGTTGDSKLDAAIQNEVLTGLQLQEPPPPGMPAPIVLRLTARRP